MKIFVTIVFVIALHIPRAAFGHSLMCPKPAATPDAVASRNAACALSVIKPRDNEHSRKGANCGGLARATTQPVNQFSPGQVIQLKVWNTILHPGRWFVEYSRAGDANFVRLATVNKPGTRDEFTIPVTLPNENCQNCTIRLVEEMTENPANPSFYYYCANANLGTAPASTTNTSGTNTTGANTTGTNTTGTNTSGGAVDDYGNSAATCAP